MSEALLIERIEPKGKNAVLIGRAVKEGKVRQAEQAWAAVQAMREQFGVTYREELASSGEDEAEAAAKGFKLLVKPYEAAYMGLVGGQIRHEVPNSKLNGTKPGKVYWI